MMLRRVLLGIAIGASMVGASTADAATISFSSNPIPLFPGSGVEITSQLASGSFNLTPGVHATESVWLYETFTNNPATFSNLSFPLSLTLNGVTGSVPFLASQATPSSGTYTSRQTALCNLIFLGLVLSM
jgi:hypothetical protein